MNQRAFGNLVLSFTLVMLVFQDLRASAAPQQYKDIEKDDNPRQHEIQRPNVTLLAGVDRRMRANVTNVSKIYLAFSYNKYNVLIYVDSPVRITVLCVYTSYFANSERSRHTQMVWLFEDWRCRIDVRSTMTFVARQVWQ